MFMLTWFASGQSTESDIHWKETNHLDLRANKFQFKSNWPKGKTHTELWWPNSSKIQVNVINHKKHININGKIQRQEWCIYMIFNSNEVSTSKVDTFIWHFNLNNFQVQIYKGLHKWWVLDSEFVPSSLDTIYLFFKKIRRRQLELEATPRHLLQHWRLASPEPITNTLLSFTQHKNYHPIFILFWSQMHSCLMPSSIHWLPTDSCNM